MKSWVVWSKNKLRTNYAKAEMWKAEKSRLKYVRPKSAKLISGVAFKWPKEKYLRCSPKNWYLVEMHKVNTKASGLPTYCKKKVQNENVFHWPRFQTIAPTSFPSFSTTRELCGCVHLFTGKPQNTLSWVQFSSILGTHCVSLYFYTGKLLSSYLLYKQ